MKKTLAMIGLVAVILQGCAIYPDYPGPGAQGGPGNGFCPPGQAKKGNC